MKNKVIVFTREDGGTSVIHPTPEMFDPESRTRLLLAEKEILSLEATDEEVFAFILEKDLPEGVAYHIADKASLPEDRSFRDAWQAEHTDETVSVHMGRAREITKERLRAERAPLLAEQDVAFQRAQENGLPTKTVTDEKKRLRDITKLADQVDTLDELKALSAKKGV